MHWQWLLERQVKNSKAVLELFGQVCCDGLVMSTMVCKKEVSVVLGIC